MIEINGSSGGGQMLRTALTMSAVENEPFEIENIRGSRSDPGLKHQHLAAVETVQRLTSAEVEGAELGSEEIVFEPNALEAESFSKNIGTAGSVTLLLDTVLPLVTQFDEGFRLDVSGGTHVKFSPAFECFSSKLELLGRFGLDASASLERTGYYPAGGGEVRFESGISGMKELRLTERGDLEEFTIRSRASEGLKDADVADRQAGELARRLKNFSVSTPVEKDVEYVDADSDGSSLVLEAVYEKGRCCFDSLGEKGRRSEEVARDVFESFEEFSRSASAVDKHLADQLMVFLAIVGGEVSIPELTPHVQTNLEVLRKFGAEIEVIEEEDIRLVA